MLKTNTGSGLLRLFLLFRQYRYIPICNTIQYMYKIKYAVCHHPRTYTNVYNGMGKTCMFKGHFNRTSFVKAWVSQSVEHQAKNLKIVGSSPTVGIIFSFLYFVAFDAFLARRLATYK